MPSENSAGTSRARRSIIARKSPSRTPSPCQALRQVSHEAIGRDPILLQRIAIAYRDRAVSGGLAVQCDPERRAGLVMTPVVAHDRAAVVGNHDVWHTQL